MIFLTGSSGFLGKFILNELTKKKIRIRCLVRTSLNKEIPGVEWLVGDLTDKNLDPDILKECSVVIHSAGLIKGTKEDLLKTNFEGTKNIIELSIKANVKKIIFISSIDALLFENSYAISKKMAEETLIHAKMDWVIVRPSQLFGLDDNKNFYFLDKAIKKYFIIPLPFYGAFKWEPVFVEDLAKYIVNLVYDESAKNRVYNVVGPECLSFRQIVSIIERYNNVDRFKISLTNGFMLFIEKLLMLILGKHKAEQFLMSFRDKIIPENDKGEKIRLSTKLSDVFHGN